MKITDDERETREGEYPACWISKSADLRKIQEHLFYNAQGYKFAIIFDTTKDEYEELTEIPVYFLDSVFAEIVNYTGVDKAERMLEEIREAHNESA